MSAAIWLEYAQRCPDCGGVSFVFARIADGDAFLVGFDHDQGYVPASVVSVKACRFAERFARNPSVSLPLGWRRLSAPPQFVPDSTVH